MSDIDKFLYNSRAKLLQKNQITKCFLIKMVFY